MFPGDQTDSGPAFLAGKPRSTSALQRPRQEAQGIALVHHLFLHLNSPFSLCNRLGFHGDVLQCAPTPRSPSNYHPLADSRQISHLYNCCQAVFSTSVIPPAFTNILVQERAFPSPTCWHVSIYLCIYVSVDSQIPHWLVIHS